MKGSIIAFTSILLFSTYTIFGKILLQEVSPFVIIVINQLLAYSILFFILKLKKEMKKLTRITKRDFKIMYAISLFSAVCGPLLFLWGLKLTTATNTILIGKAEALLTSLIAVMMLKERISMHQITGAMTMFFGIVIIATNNFANGLSFNIGDLLVLASSLSFAFGTILFKKYMHHLPPEVIVTVRNLCGATLLFVISLYLVDYSTLLNALNAKFVLALLGLVVLTTIFAQSLWYRALETTTATKVSLIGLSSPLIAIVYAIIFLKESLGTSQLIGGSFVILGLIMLEFHFKIWPRKIHKRYLKLKHWPHI